MSAARERLERINQLRLGDGDVDFLVASLRCALDALERAITSECLPRMTCREALADINALAGEGTGKP